MSPIAEYETFDYKYFNEPVLSLNEASEKAAALRRADAQNVYRIMPHESGFIIVRVPLARAYADRSTALLSRLWRWLPVTVRTR